MKKIIVIGLSSGILLVIYIFIIPFQTGGSNILNKWCLDRISEQELYLESESDSSEYNFNDYKVNIHSGDLSNLDVSSNIKIAQFKTIVNDQLKAKGIDFAGKYTIVSIGMTGWGRSYAYVDRTNGKAYIIPYKSTFIDYRKDSSLLVINPNDQVLKSIEDGLSCTTIGDTNIRYYEARPNYLTISDIGMISIIKQNSLPLDSFWTDYF